MNVMIRKSKFSLSDRRGFLSSKKTLENLFKGSKTRLFFVLLFYLIFIGSLLFVVVYLTNFLVKGILDIAIRNFGKFLVSTLLTELFASILLAGIFSPIIVLLISGLNKRITKNKWLILNIFLICFVLIFGFYALDSSIGNPPLSLNLFDTSTMNAVGTIKCGGTQGPAIIGDEIICKTDLNEKDQFVPEKEKIIPVLTINNEKANPIMSNIALENTTYLGIRVFETYLNGTEVKFEVGYPYSFIDKDEFQKNKERFIQFFLAFLAVAFVTVPLVVLNFRNLWRNNQD